MKQHSESPTVTGIYHASGKGYGFVTPEGEEAGEDLFIPPRHEHGAWNGDRVTARVTEADPSGRTAGAVTAVLERKNRLVTGTLSRMGRALYLAPSSDKLPAIRVTGKVRSARSGDKAAVSMVSFGGRDGVPMGTLQETFGPSGTRESSAAAILYENEIERAFPPAVLEEAEGIPDTVPEEAMAGRLDLREQCVITIDGASSKDFDDAVSLIHDEHGAPVLGVHIADVSHYVTPGSFLDREAFERGTSVYFADQVIPMLPPSLSNGICSLNPHVDRLTLSCLMTLAPDGSVSHYTLAQSVIRSAERMTYEDCNRLLAEEDPQLAVRYAHILPMLRELDQIAAKQAKRRALRGALDLSSNECAIQCDESGRPVGVTFRQQGRSEKLIEQCMLAANETVAMHFAKLNKPAVYRVHEKPASGKVDALRLMLAPLGYDLKEADHGTLQNILRKAAGTPEELAVNTMILRSMMKARYDEKNLGHFGLASEYYCHFTSPIRRYPDLVVHRFLTQLLTGAMTPTQEKKDLAFAQKAARQSSQREIAAQTAERAIEKLYLAEYMSAFVGDSFPGVVSGASRNGLFVLLPCGAEGFLPAEALPGGPYVYEENRLRLTDSQSGASYTVGALLTVLCMAADPGSGRIDLALPGAATPPSQRKQRRPERAAQSAHTKEVKRTRKSAMHVPKQKRRKKR